MNIRDLAEGRVTVTELLAYAVEKVLQQDSIAMQDGSCMYRANNGAKCLIGNVIDDADYSPQFETRAPQIIFEKLGIHNISDHDIVLLRLAQSQHDEAARSNRGNIDTFREVFKSRMAPFLRCPAA